MHDSFGRQVEHLSSAGFPSKILMAVVGTLLKKIKGGPCHLKESLSKRLQARISHNLRKLHSGMISPLVFSPCCKLAQLCSRVANMSGNKALCSVKHKNKYVECVGGAV